MICEISRTRSLGNALFVSELNSFLVARHMIVVGMASSYLFLLATAYILGKEKMG